MDAYFDLEGRSMNDRTSIIFLLAPLIIIVCQIDDVNGEVALDGPAPDSDINESGMVDIADFALFAAMYRGTPGPSGLAP